MLKKYGLRRHRTERCSPEAKTEGRLFGAAVSLGYVGLNSFNAVNNALEQAGCSKVHVAGIYDLKNAELVNHSGELSDIEDMGTLILPFLNASGEWLSGLDRIRIDYRRLIVEPLDNTSNEPPYWHVDFGGGEHRVAIASDSLPTLLFRETEPGYPALHQSRYYAEDAIVREAVAAGVGKISAADEYEVMGIDQNVLHASQPNRTGKAVSRSFIRMISRAI